MDLQLISILSTGSYIMQRNQKREITGHGKKRDMCEHKLVPPEVLCLSMNYLRRSGRGDTDETEGLCVVNSEGQG